jgi:hypothetical protein
MPAAAARGRTECEVGGGSGQGRAVEKKGHCRSLSRRAGLLENVNRHIAVYPGRVAALGALPGIAGARGSIPEDAFPGFLGQTVVDVRRGDGGMADRH